jgi:transcriptional regulator with XRE-family HTH domain
VRENILEKFGQRVRAKRLRQGLTQEKLASKAGVHRTYIGMIERAEKNITLENVQKIAKALQVTPSDLLNFTNKNV